MTLASAAPGRTARHARLTVCAAAGIALFAVPGPAQPQGTADIRVSADGAGPSHLFWLTGDQKSDVVGVVDPLFAAIRFYRVARAVRPGEPLAGRLTALGVCAIPVDFRPWRIHAFRGSVAIESMPDPGALGQGARAADFRTRVLNVPRRLLGKPARLDAAARRIDTRDWDPASEVPCGTVSRAGKVGAGMPERASRLSARAIRLANGRGALAPPRLLTVYSRVNRLFSAREIEPAGSSRIVQASEAIPSDDGVVRIRSRILVYHHDADHPSRAITLRASELRGKFGLKPLAALPSGELLVMGKQPGSAGPFRLLSCGYANGALDPRLCGLEALPPPASPHAALRTVPARATSLRTATIFANVARLANYRLRVDTSRMPADCRRAEGCRVGESGDRFVPIRGIRLTRGIFERRGMPYAQARVPQDIDRLLGATSGQLSHALAEVSRGARGWPGNLRDGLEGDLGVDCSGLVQIAWGGTNGQRLNTAGLQALSSPLACSARLPGPEYLRAGDAIGLNVGLPRAQLVGHVMLFAAAMRPDGANDAWLMLESSSGCDGVCWSVYDPSLFDGWGLYRAAGRADAACLAGNAAAATPIPYDLTRWSLLAARR
ncbi:hypothetical protein [Sphingomonas sp.]|uniref:hypothetical protein n=1 Tax=Sphingomonas sp. TaxID=28214 RepID=UPI001B06DB76|nr:hypothetical protein [Sphingomonas sp.]MBO9713751.1 hypothetical protein [Sphingomonas sp.]